MRHVCGPIGRAEHCVGCCWRPRYWSAARSWPSTLTARSRSGSSCDRAKIFSRLGDDLRAFRPGRVRTAGGDLDLAAGPRAAVGNTRPGNDCPAFGPGGRRSENGDSPRLAAPLRLPGERLEQFRTVAAAGVVGQPEPEFSLGAHGHRDGPGDFADACLSGGAGVVLPGPLLVAYQRMDSGAHFLSDVLCGAAVACMVAAVTVRLGWLDREYSEQFWGRVGAIRKDSPAQAETEPPAGLRIR